ncbi:MAG: hypothetical protein OXI33_02025 [Chloroflexota bacterium]|nr:hypothetical protein [Chloroflexota bacterium]
MSTFSLPQLNQPIFLTETQVQFHIDGNLTSAPATITQHLWPRPGVVIRVSEVARNPQPISENSSDPAPKGALPILSEGPTKVQLDNGVWIAVVPNSWIPFQEEAELRLQQNPSTVLETGKPITRLQFDLLNITGDLFDRPLVLQTQSCIVQISPVPNFIELENALRKDSGYAVTHRGIVQCIEGESFSMEDARILRWGLEHFLSFACGTQCRATNIVGFDAEGNEAWKQWGSYHVNLWSKRLSWSDLTIRGALTGIFERFWMEYRKSKEHLDRILGWYVYSNETSAADLSIVLNQTVLEILTSLMPSGEEGESRGTRIVKMLRNQGIDLQIPDVCSKLKALAAQHGFEHGPRTLAEIRNSMVHPNESVEMDSIDAYYEAKQLGLWYIDLLLLRMFEYEGEYVSRLGDAGLPGDTELVPWSNEVSPDGDDAR